MKASFHVRLLNDPVGDPCLFIRINREKRALLFDLGEISRLVPAELNIVSDAFVTHLHMDHFVGFPRLLRAVLRRQQPLNLYGPPPLTRCVQSAMRGFLWNLIADYPTEINVFEYNGRTIRHTRFRASSRFRKEVVGTESSSGTLAGNSLFRVRAVRLWHGTACLAYALEEKTGITIDRDRLLKKGLAIGPWLREFKEMLREGVSGRTRIMAGGERLPISSLKDIARFRTGMKIVYATDLAGTKENLRSLASLAAGADVLYCEAPFLDCDRVLAHARRHLTARQCGLVAAEAGVKKLVPMHFSPRYATRENEIVQEAMDAFHGSEM